MATGTLVNIHPSEILSSDVIVLGTNLIRPVKVKHFDGHVNVSVAGRKRPIPLDYTDFSSLTVIREAKAKVNA